MSTFGAQYAASYDSLYSTKDYEAECDLLERVFDRSPIPVRSVLDLGCGTGGHANRLARRGYEVVGVDRSREMLDIARRNAEDASAMGARFLQGDVRSIRLGSQFDAVICMFAVLGYQTTERDVRGTLRTFRAHLRPKGPLVFDVWYGPAVEGTGPSRRVKLVNTPTGEVERAASASLDRRRHICTVRYSLIERRSGAPDNVSQEVHRMRYFFPDELARLLSEIDLPIVDLAPFPGTTDALSNETWNVLVTAGWAGDRE